jgi:Caleosin related protein
MSLVMMVMMWRDRIIRDIILMSVWQHGSDSGTYDKEGRFVPQMFEDMFSKWDTDNDGALSAGQLLHMIAGHRVAVDPFGVSL